MIPRRPDEIDAACRVGKGGQDRTASARCTFRRAHAAKPDVVYPLARPDRVGTADLPPYINRRFGAAFAQPTRSFMGPQPNRGTTCGPIRRSRRLATRMPSDLKPILVIGSLNMDLVVRCGSLPRAGQTI